VETDPEAAYYQDVEEFFVSRRGDPLMLSNPDWLLVRRWRSEGVPLRIVLRGIEDALDAHAHSFSRHRKVGSLAYCESEVDAARDRWRQALDVGREERGGLDVAAGLRHLADALDRARGLGPRALKIASRLADEMRAPTGTLRLADAEPRLVAGEAELLEAIQAEAGEAAAAEIDAAVETVLGPYAGRMPARVLDQIRTDSRARRWLARHGLPRLSLFHLEDDSMAPAAGAEGR
jgi:hypothetical protein